MGVRRPAFKPRHSKSRVWFLTRCYIRDHQEERQYGGRSLREWCLCHPQRRRERDMWLAIRMPLFFLSPCSSKSPPTNPLLRQKEAQEPERPWLKGKEGRDGMAISSSHSGLLFIQPTLSTSCVSDMGFQLFVYINWERSGPLPRSTAPKEWGLDRNPNLTQLMTCGTSLALLVLSTHFKKFLTEILGRA